MKQVGYSGKELLDKLGYKPGQSVCMINQPGWFRGLLRSGDVIPAQILPAHWVHGFFSSKTEFESFLDSVDFDGIKVGLWVSWPKKSSKVQTDVTEQTFRDLILPLGWVDIKVAAIDETWSGLKLPAAEKVRLPRNLYRSIKV